MPSEIYSKRESDQCVIWKKFLWTLGWDVFEEKGLPLISYASWNDFYFNPNDKFGVWIANKLLQKMLTNIELDLHLDNDSLEFFLFLNIFQLVKTKT